MRPKFIKNSAQKRKNKKSQNFSKKLKPLSQQPGGEEYKQV